MIEWCSEKWMFSQLSSEQTIYLWWETEREIWSWSLLGVKGLKLSLMLTVSCRLHSSSQSQYLVHNSHIPSSLGVFSLEPLAFPNQGTLFLQRSLSRLIRNFHVLETIAPQFLIRKKRTPTCLVAVQGTASSECPGKPWRTWWRYTVLTKYRIADPFSIHVVEWQAKKAFSKERKRDRKNTRKQCYQELSARVGNSSN